MDKFDFQQVRKPFPAATVKQAAERGLKLFYLAVRKTNDRFDAEDWSGSLMMAQHIPASGEIVHLEDGRPCTVRLVRNETVKIPECDIPILIPTVVAVAGRSEHPEARKSRGQSAKLRSVR